jgi:5-methylcytosine-specific restriction endonuclease McrA
MMGRDCWAHRHRDDVPLEVHHVWPLGHGGPDAKPNKVSLCANAHSATHDLLAKMLKAGTHRPPWLVRIRYGRGVRRLAVAGYAAIKARTVIAP